MDNLVYMQNQPSDLSYADILSSLSKPNNGIRLQVVVKVDKSKENLPITIVYTHVHVPKYYTNVIELPEIGKSNYRYNIYPN